MLVEAPWQVSAGLAVAGYALLTWILPAAMGSNKILGPMSKVLSPFGALVALVFGLVAVASFFWNRKHRVTMTLVEPTMGRAPETPTVREEISNDKWAEFMARRDARSTPTHWSIDVLRDIEWKRFEEVVAAWFREKGFRCDTQTHGPDGGVDAKVYEGDQLGALVQCKAWNTKPVGVAQVRELFGVVTKEKVKKGYFMTTGIFSDEAKGFAKDTPIILVDGNAFLVAIQKLDTEAQARLLAVATEGDYTTPTCPSCGIKMVPRQSGEATFWGCRNYPRCKSKIFATAA